MLYNYNEVLKLYKSDYNLQKAIMKKEIFKIERGIYSDQKKNFDRYELILKKYPKSFLVKESALFYIGFISQEPEKIHLGTSRNALRIKNSNIQQHFYKNLNIDTIHSKYYTFKNILSHNNIVKYITENNNEIRLLNFQALLYDFIRNKPNMNSDTFENIINQFKNSSFLINFEMQNFEHCLEYDKVKDYYIYDDLLFELQRISWDNDFYNS